MEFNVAFANRKCKNSPGSYARVFINIRQFKIFTSYCYSHTVMYINHQLYICLLCFIVIIVLLPAAGE